MLYLLITDKHCGKCFLKKPLQCLVKHHSEILFLPLGFCHIPIICCTISHCQHYIAELGRKVEKRPASTASRLASDIPSEHKWHWCDVKVSFSRALHPAAGRRKPMEEASPIHIAMNKGSWKCRVFKRTAHQSISCTPEISYTMGPCLQKSFPFIRVVAVCCIPVFLFILLSIGYFKRQTDVLPFLELMEAATKTGSRENILWAFEETLWMDNLSTCGYMVTFGSRSLRFPHSLK